MTQDNGSERRLTPRAYTFSRYLAAKRSVDDRALNTQVRQALAEQLAGAAQARPLAVLEIGAGTGAMLERLLAWNLLPAADYTAIDLQAENIAEARRCLPERAAGCGYAAETDVGGEIVLTRSGNRLRAHLEAVDLFDFMRREDGRSRWDLLMAHAFLDLIDIPSALPRLFRLLRPGGLFYFTLNFDGETILEPAVDPPLDELVIRLYHQTMDHRTLNGLPSGDSRSGRHMFAHLEAAGARLLAAGASDWVVHPQEGAYPGDEAYFLHFIVETMRGALAGHPELDAAAFERWIEARRRQIDAGRLVYIAHQLDFVGFAPGV